LIVRDFEDAPVSGEGDAAMCSDLVFPAIHNMAVISAINPVRVCGDLD
jgi:hypothetical protein